MLVGDYGAAEEAWRELSELLSGFDDLYFAIAHKHRLAYVLWQTGQMEEALKLFNEQIHQNLDIIENGIETDVRGEANDLAGIYAFLGDEKEALKWMQMSADIGFLPIGLLDRDPLFNGIRQNDQFKKIIAQKKEEEETEEEVDRPKFEIARKKIRELEQKGILIL